MITIAVPDAAVDVLRNWMEQDAAALAITEIDRTMSFLLSQNDLEAEEVVRHLRTLHLLRRELMTFVPQKGGEL